MCGRRQEAWTCVSSLAEGRTMVVVMVDFTNEVLQHLTPLSSREELEAAHAFDVLESYLVRWETRLLQKLSPGLQFYSAEDVPQTPPKRPTRRREQGVGIGGDTAPKPAAKKRPTVGHLADHL